MALQTIVLYSSAGLSAETALRDSILSNLLLAISAFTILTTLRYYQPNLYLRILYSIVLAIGATFFSQRLAPAVVSNDESYARFFADTFLLRCVFGWLMISFISAIVWLWSALQEQQEIAVRKNANEKLIREAELASLRQQLQPHFLFNSLNSISALAGTKPEQARQMIQQLSDFLRGTLKRDEQQLIPLSDELSQLQLYLEIEKVRFGHRLKTDISVDDTATNMKLPSLLLQPVVENAIKFGLYDTIGEITITVKITGENQMLQIQVNNPFDADTSKSKHGTGFGLNSVRRRLDLLFLRQDLLQTFQHDNIFTTVIKIPQLT